MGRIWSIFRLAAILTMMVAAPLVAGRAAVALPNPFTDTLVASVPTPIDLAVVERGPQRGAIFVTSKSGALYYIPSGSGQARKVLDLTARVCSDGERGMLGVALDPRFGAGSNGIYLYYTAEEASCVNRVSRFEIRSSGSVDLGSEQMLVETAPLGPTNHNGGDLEFGADGYLYVSVGENGRPSLAQRRNSYFGKILRVTTTGAPAPGNPWKIRKGAIACGLDGRTKKAPCAEIFALGLRNPFQIAFAPGSNNFMINDVGQSTWEEIDRGRKGANYGWPAREGPCPQGMVLPCPAAPSGYTDPVAWYSHDTGCDSITAGTFVPSSAGWPSEFDGDYLVADFICGNASALSDPLGPTPVLASFLDALGPVVAWEFDPVQPGSLLYTNLIGEIRRISTG